jgi:hypothetical protein
MRRPTQLELAGIEQFRDPVTDPLVQPVHPGVDERGALVIDHELVELKPGVRKLNAGADSVDVVDELVYAGYGGCSSLCPFRRPYRPRDSSATALRDG